MGTVVCAAWGEGPVQGKIYSGPQYIEEGFPLIDKFLTCTVKRSNATGSDPEVDPDNALDDEVEGDGTVDDGAGDGGDDRAEDTKDDDEKEEGLEVVPISANHQGEEMDVRRLGAKSALRDDSQGLIIPAVMLVVLMIFFLSLRSRKKESGKMN